MKKILLLFSAILLCSGMSPDISSIKTANPTAKTVQIHSDNLVSQTDISNQDIYNFMKVVIADQKLDLSYGLTIKPEPNCDLSQNDKAFLSTMLIENKKQNTKADTDATRN